MNCVLFDDARSNLLPLTFTRPVADIRFGMLTIREKWERALKTASSTLTEDYLRVKFPLLAADDNLLINGSVCPSPALLAEIRKLKTGEALVKDNLVVAARVDAGGLKTWKGIGEGLRSRLSAAPFLRVTEVWDIFQRNGEAIADDYAVLTKGRISAKLHTSNTVFGGDVFAEKGARVQGAMINAEEGPVYIGRDAVVMEGSMLRGPLALCEHATVKMGAKIYGPTTIGPHSKVGGEVTNTVIFGHSNKAHDGFLGNSVIGEWCNLGADTNCSNLKNNYSPVRIWSYARQEYVDSGLLFFGLIMADHSKCGINTMFNTGTIVGVSANVFGGGFPSKHIPSFSWGGQAGFSVFDMEKAFEVAERVMERRGMKLSEADKDVLKAVFERR